MKLEIVQPEEDQAIAMIKAMQQQYGLSQLQAWIDSGQAWHLEGSVGRAAMNALESGACLLPDIGHVDVWGNIVPGRQHLAAGTKGTLENSIRFWSDPENYLHLEEMADEN
jgi:hypothetical protein